MNIFLFVNSFPNYNFERRGIFNYRFVKQLLGLDVKVTVVFIRTWLPGRKIINTYIYEGIEVTEVFFPLFPFPNYLFMIVNIWICKKLGWLVFKRQLKKCDLIHSVYLSTNGNIATYWSKKSKKTHISQAIGSDVNSDLANFVKKKNTKWVSNINGIIANSKDLEKTVKSLLPDCPVIETIYRGISINKIEFGNYGTKNDFFFLFLGGLMANKSLVFGKNTKGGITLMESWQMVEEKLHNINAKLYFGGPDSDCRTFRLWKNTLKYPKSVELIGEIEPKEVNSFLQRSDISIVPSMEEGLPNFLMESAANGKPTIGSNAGDIPEIVVDGITGFLFNKGDATRLANLLVTAASNRDTTVAMGKAAFTCVNNNFNSDHYSNDVRNFYFKIIKKCVE